MRHHRYPVMRMMKRSSLYMPALLPALLISTALALLPSCGRKGPLIVPGTVLPVAVTDLKAEPKDSAVILSWTMPDKNTKGDPLSDLAGFTVSRAEMPQDKEQCACTFEKVGYVDLEYPKGALINGKKVVWADRGPGLIFGRKYQYKVAAVNTGNFSGADSAAFAVHFLMPPMKPEGLSGHSLNRSAVLSWSPVTRDESGKDVADIAGYNVYRAMKPGQALDGPVNSAPVKGGRYEDFGLTNNVTYYYHVAALRGGEAPYTEGDFAGPFAVTPSDKAPPAPPMGLVAVPAEDAVLLSWDIGPEADIAGYNVYRKAEGEKDFTRLTPGPDTKITFRDADVRPGVTYTYAVTAVDNANPPNESPLSETATVQTRENP